MMVAQPHTTTDAIVMANTCFKAVIIPNLNVIPYNQVYHIGFKLYKKSYAAQCKTLAPGCITVDAGTLRMSNAMRCQYEFINLLISLLAL